MRLEEGASPLFCASRLAVIRIAILVFCIIVLFHTIPLAKSQKGITSTTLDIPLNYYTLSLVIGLVGIVLYLLVSITREERKGPEKVE